MLWVVIRLIPQEGAELVNFSIVNNTLIDCETINSPNPPFMSLDQMHKNL